MGLPLFGKVGSGTPVFKILVRALDLVTGILPFEISNPTKTMLFFVLYRINTLSKNLKQQSATPSGKKEE